MHALKTALDELKAQMPTFAPATTGGPTLPPAIRAGGPMVPPAVKATGTEHDPWVWFKEAADKQQKLQKEYEVAMQKFLTGKPWLK